MLHRFPKGCMSQRTRPFALFALLAGVLLAAAGPVFAAPPAPPLEHVFVVMLENHSYEQVIGNPAMPYLNGLAKRYGLATNFYANTHPSIGNYFMATAGQIVTNDDQWEGVFDGDNIVRALTKAGKSWRVYAQSLPAAGYVGGSRYPYSKHHIPFAYFKDVRDDPALAANIVEYGQLRKDLEASALPNYAFLVPDKMNDAHDCPAAKRPCGDDDQLAAADRWLEQNIGPLLNDADFMKNGLLIIDWDEAEEHDHEHGGGHVAVVVAGGRVPPGLRSDRFYQQESVLATSLAGLGVSARPGASAGALVMSEFYAGR
jgi:phospholipase C